jgi:acyl transferase domain-containing protein/NADPH:quinone reductase-like Zn-dependent oxidoreductase/ubiquinone/menaquinone biosynthesis C-methylase UbiE
MNNSSLDKHHGAVAITGIGLRLPGGACDTRSFWELMCNRVDCIQEIPDDRWSISRFYHTTQQIPGKTYSKWGGFLSDLDQFDAGFFGLSAQEVDTMDPQQRLLLEASWHALEDSGHPVHRRDAANIGVFVGISTSDYPRAISDPLDLPHPSPFSATGMATSISANRISHLLNLKGPSFAVDTACSSSLVAFHLACQSILNEECERAIVGGVNAILDPSTWIAFSNMSALSKDGRCKAFDASADGFVRSEGVGAVVLKPLSQAIADGDRVHAVVRATAVNQDGWTPAIAMPNQEAQELMILDACRRAGIRPGDISFVEAHGTGTSIGDPIEAKAIGNVIGKDRKEGDPVIMGSVKTNIGHMESAAGIASIIKTALVLSRREVPPNLHFQTPNPAIPFESLNLRVPTEMLPLPEEDAPLLASVNSFGFGGANAHAILEAAPEPDGKCISTGSSTGPEVEQRLPARILRLSAQSTESLEQLAKAYSERITANPEQLDAFCRTAAVHRGWHRHTAAILGKDADEMARNLAAFQSGESLSDIQQTSLVTGNDRTVAPFFVFSGQGSQWHAMGRLLMESSPVYRDKLEQCHEALQAAGEYNLIDELSRDKESSRLHLTEIAQPAIFGVQVALVELWKSMGVRPEAVIGHSVGEVAAAYCAGALGLADAARVIFHRARSMGCATGGKMIAVGVSAEQAEEAIAPYGERLSLAAINGPETVSISGDPDALEELVPRYEADNIFCRYVPVDYAFHSAHMDPIKDDLLKSLEGIRPQEAEVPVYSTVTGDRIAGEEFGAEYWWNNVRQTVQFAPAVEKMIEAQADRQCYQTIFIEMGGHPVLAMSLNQCIRQMAESRGDRPVNGIALPSLRRDVEDWSVFLPSLGQLVCEGLPLDWDRICPPTPERADLPLYPWSHERFWLQSPHSREMRLTPCEHAFLVTPMRAQDPTWHLWLDRKNYPFLNDHAVQDRLIFPGAGYVELALELCAHAHGDGACILEEVEFQRALHIPESGPVPTVRVVHEQETSTFEVYSATDAACRTWTLNATGGLRMSKRTKEPSTAVMADARNRCTRPVPVDELYTIFEEAGLQYGPLFRGLSEVRQGESEAWARITLPPSLQAELPAYRVHPVLLDAAFQLVIATLSLDSGKSLGAYMPTFINRLRVYSTAPAELCAHARLTKWSKDRIEADLQLTTPEGEVVADLEGLICQSVEVHRSDLPEGFPRLLHTEWDLVPFPKQEPSPAADSLPPLPALAKDLQLSLDTYLEELGLQSRLGQFARLEALLTTSWIEEALIKVGINPKPGETVTVDSILSSTNILPRYRQLLNRWMQIFRDQQLVESIGEGAWRVRAPWGQIDRTAVQQELLQSVPGAITEVEISTLCGAHLVDILTGEQDPVQLLFASNHAHILDKFYTTSIILRSTNHTLRGLGYSISKALPQGRRLRILEIGAGTGGTTAAILPELPKGHFQYTFTDLSEAFFSAAEEKFDGHTEIEFRKLDISQDPASQGYEDDYDLVIATDVIHATPDLRTTLRNVRSLLRPGGCFTLAEVDNPPVFTDLVFGLTEGWWAFKDHDLRPDHALLPRDRWRELLHETGFQDIEVVSECHDGSIPAHGVYLMTSPETVTVESALNEKPVEEKPAEAESSQATVEPEPIELSSGAWLILADSEQDPTATELASRFKEQKHEVRVAAPGTSADLSNVLTDMAASKMSLHGVIYLGALAMPKGNDFETDALLEEQRRYADLPVILSQELAKADRLKPPARLWFITQGGQAVCADDEVDCLQAPLHGLARVINSGLREFNTCVVDLSSKGNSVELDLLFQEFFHTCQEDQVAYRGEGRYVPTLRKAMPSSQRAISRQTGAEQACRLTSRQFGVLEHLALQTVDRPAPGDHEVEVEVRAAALNFRDVMKALRIYPSDAPDAEHIGDEYSGIISRVGKNVTQLKMGDRVCGAWMGTFRSHLILPSNVVCPIPENMNFEEAATPIVACMTAYKALHTVARIQTGERLLVHSAAGGVGLAAIQLGLAAGAEIYATAGSPLKRSFLQNLGIHHVFDSRSLEFADDIMEATNGEGVDIVLNSLAGEAIPKSLSCLRADGRFIEIGKRDIYGNSRIGLRPFQRTLSFTALDLSSSLQPEHLASVITSFNDLLQNGTIRPLPYRSNAISTEPATAFRYMAQGKHIGKIVLSLGQERLSPIPETKPGGSFVYFRMRPSSSQEALKDSVRPSPATATRRGHAILFSSAAADNPMRRAPRPSRRCELVVPRCALLGWTLRPVRR